MARSREGNNWFWDYFTSVNDIAKCDICYSSLQITHVPKHSLMKHIQTKHSVDYQRIVSSRKSQKDLESQLYIIQNKDITCKFCNFICYATSNFCHIKNHLENIHKINKDIAAEICEWLRKNYFDESDTDMTRHCITCNERILNKPLLLMNHLSTTHQVNVPLEIRSVRFLTSSKWVWEYFSKSEEQKAKCSVCNHPFFLLRSLSKIINHINRKHGNNFNVSEDTQGNKNWLYSITENNQIKCDICEKIYVLSFNASSHMKTHLIEAHNLNEDIARKLCNWVLEYFHISKFQTSKCNICENMFHTSNCFDLMIHLKEAHQVRVSPEFIPTRLSSELSSLFNSDRCAQDNALSISSNQPTRNVDQNSDCDNLYDQIDNPSEIKRTRYEIWRQSRYY